MLKYSTYNPDFSPEVGVIGTKRLSKIEFRVFTIILKKYKCKLKAQHLTYTSNKQVNRGVLSVYLLNTKIWIAE